MINSFVYGQEINSLDFLFKNPDKVTISTIFFQDKTTIPTIPILIVKDSISDTYISIQTSDEPEEVIRKIEEKELSKEETAKLIKLIQKRNRKGVPLPYIYDIQLDFYKEGTVLQVVTISSVTKNSRQAHKLHPKNSGRKSGRRGLLLYGGSIRFFEKVPDPTLTGKTSVGRESMF